MRRLRMSRRRFVVGAGGALAAAGLTPLLPDWPALRRIGLATVAMANFTNTSIEVLIGNDRLTGSATLVEKPIKGGGRWRLQSEP